MTDPTTPQDRYALPDHLPRRADRHSGRTGATPVQPQVEAEGSQADAEGEAPLRTDGAAPGAAGLQAGIVAAITRIRTHVLIGTGIAAVLAVLGALLLTAPKWTAGLLAGGGVLLIGLVTWLILGLLREREDQAVAWVAASYLLKIGAAAAAVLVAKSMEAHPIYVAIWIVIAVIAASAAEIIGLSRARITAVD